jgi:hypothetical protein
MQINTDKELEAIVLRFADERLIVGNGNASESAIMKEFRMWHRYNVDARLYAADYKIMEILTNKKALARRSDGRWMCIIRSNYY